MTRSQLDPALNGQQGRRGNEVRQRQPPNSGSEARSAPAQSEGTQQAPAPHPDEHASPYSSHDSVQDTAPYPTDTDEAFMMHGALGSRSPRATYPTPRHDRSHGQTTTRSSGTAPRQRRGPSPYFSAYDEDDFADSRDFRGPRRSDRTAVFVPGVEVPDIEMYDAVGPPVPGGVVEGNHPVFLSTGYPYSPYGEWGTYNGVPQEYGSPLGVVFEFPPPPISGYRRVSGLTRDGQPWYIYAPLVYW